MKRISAQSVAAVYHGALDYAELERLGLSPDAILDFSVNSNPFGPSAAVKQAVECTPLERYPDRQSLALRRALAARHQTQINNICVGNGTAELIGTLAAACLKPADAVLIIGPTFGEYERACRLVGVVPHFWNANATDNFDVHPAEIETCFTNLKPRLVFICNPNNPTGRLLPVEVLRRWAESHSDILFVVDEAYLSFVPDQACVFSPDHANILVLRSMTKDYALAGLRLGYVLAHESIITALAERLPPWNVNAPAQAAGLAALNDPLYNQQWAQLPVLKQALVSELSGLGLAVYPSALHFFLVQTGSGALFRQKLLRRGLLVRDCASFGLPDCIRISTRLPQDNRRLLAAIREVLKEHDG